MFSSLPVSSPITPVDCMSVGTLILLTQVLLVSEASRQSFDQERDFSSDVIWFPIDGYDGGIQSSRGEIFLSRLRPRWRSGRSIRETWYNKRGMGQTEEFTSGGRWKVVARRKQGRRDLPQNSAPEERNNEYGHLVKLFGRARANSDNRYEETNFWNFLMPSFTSETIVFPGPTNTNEKQIYDAEQDVTRDCERSCPVTPQFNPVCGSDGINYNNIGALKCAQYCGKSVNVFHYGVCGSGLPNIFKPRPRRPKSTTPVPVDRIR